MPAVADRLEVLTARAGKKAKALGTPLRLEALTDEAHPYWEWYRRHLAETARPLFVTLFLAGARAGVDMPMVKAKIREKHLAGQHDQQRHGHGGPDLSAADREGADDIKGYLTTVSGIATAPAGYVHSSALILEHGKAYPTDADTYAGKRGTPKQCYANAGRMATRDSSLTYVEGYTTVHGVPIEHAWVVNKKGTVIDPTLKNGDNIRGYFGVPFTTEYLNKTIARKGTWGLIDGMTNRDLFKKDLPNGVVHKALEEKHLPGKHDQHTHGRKSINWDQNPLSFAAYRDAPNLSAQMTDVAGANAIRKQFAKQGRLNPDGRTVSVYHVTDSDNVESITSHGLIPSAKVAPGQPFAARHSSYATYFHGSEEGALADLERANEDMPGAFALIKANIPITPKALLRIIPDEDLGMKITEGLSALLEGDAVAIIGGVPAASVSRYIPKGKTLEEKHLPGKHDQQSHGRGGGGRSFTPGLQDRTLEIQEAIVPEFKPWADSLNRDEQNMVIGYTEASSPLNEYLRNGKEPSAADAKEILDYGYTGHLPTDAANLDSALRKASMPETTITYRGIRAGRDYSEGDTFVDKGFASTSLNLHVASIFADQKSVVHNEEITTAFMVARVKVPKGAHAAAVNSVYGVRRNEAEILLSRNSRYRVTKIHPPETITIKRPASDARFNLPDVVLNVLHVDMDLLP